MGPKGPSVSYNKANGLALAADRATRRVSLARSLLPSDAAIGNFPLDHSDFFNGVHRPVVALGHHPRRLVGHRCAAPWRRVSPLADWLSRGIERTLCNPRQL